MATTMAAAIAAAEGPDLDRIVGYSISPPRRAPTDPRVAVAFADFNYGPMRALVHRLAARERAPLADAEDAVHDAFVDLYAGRPGVFREKPESWLGLLYSTSRHKLNQVRRGAHRLASLESADDSLQLEPCVPPTLASDEDARYGPMPGVGEEWTYTQVIGALQRFRDHHGRRPRTRECARINGLPSRGAIRRHFSDFTSALLAAGMLPKTLGLRRKSWSAIEVAKACRGFRRRHGRWPGWADIKRQPGALPSAGVMIRFFGSTRAAHVQMGSEAILRSRGLPVA